MLDDLAHFRDGLAAGVAAELFEEGETRGVDVHRGGEDIMRDHVVELCKHRLAIPGLDRRDRKPAERGAVGDRVLHDLGVDAVARKGKDAAVDGGLHHLGVIALVMVLRAVVHIHGAERGDKERRGEAAAEQLKGNIGITDILAERVHVHEDLLPFVIVARGGIAGRLAAGTGDVVAAGLAVADRAGHAMRRCVLSGFFEYFFVFHIALSIRESFFMADLIICHRG